jgi:Protein of unknown function (DUF3237)
MVTTYAEWMIQLRKEESMQLLPEFVYRVRTTGPLPSTSGSPRGERLVEQTPLFKAAAEADRPTTWDDQYMRLMIRFDTGALAYRWLNTSLFVARGPLLGKGHIEYEVCRVS